MYVSRFLPLVACSVFMLGTSSCQTQDAPVLSGQIVLKTGWRPVLYLVQPRHFGDIAANYAGLVVDSAVIRPDGRFVFGRFQAPVEPALYELVIQPESSRFANKLSDDDPETANYLPIVLKKGEKIHLRAEADHLSVSATVKSDLPDNQAIVQLRNTRQQAFNRFMRQPAGDVHTDDAALLEQAARLEQYHAPLMAFADTSVSFWAALVAVRWVGPDGDYERAPEFLHRQCGRWRETQVNRMFAAQLCQLSAPGKLPVMTGDTIPDVALPMSDGDTLHLHTLLGKRLTLLDLWASWCAPCRRENREVLAPLRAQYNTPDFAIIGYALDSSPGAWKAAIQKDGALWPQASHLGGDTSPFLDVLRVTTIPANYLLDKNGKVVAKNLHGAALREFVEKYLSK